MDCWGLERDERTRLRTANAVADTPGVRANTAKAMQELNLNPSFASHHYICGTDTIAREVRPEIYSARLLKTDSLNYAE